MRNIIDLILQACELTPRDIKGQAQGHTENPCQS